MLRLELFDKHEIDVPMKNGYRDMGIFAWKSCNSPFCILTFLAQIPQLATTSEFLSQTWT